MLIAPKALSSSTLSREELAADKKEAVHYGHCALGKRAVYVGRFGLFSCTHYLPLTRVERVFKRLAVSKGFYEGKAFGTLSYLVVRYDGGKERQCRFEREDELDMMLSAFRSRTSIPVGKN